MKIVVVSMCTVLCISLNSFGQHPTRPTSMIQHFFRTLKTEGLDKATNALKSELNPSADKNLSSKANSELAKIDTSFSLDDWRYFSDVVLGRDLVLMSYLVKYDNQPYRFDLLLYYKQNHWWIQDFAIGVITLEEMKKAAVPEKLPANNRVTTN